VSRTVRTLLEDAPAIRPDTPGAQVYDLFSEERDLLVCAIVEDDRPIGMVSRNAFFLRMADLHGRALFAKRPITFVMNKDPLIVEADQPISEINRMIVTDRPSALFDGFIVTRDGKYAGVGTGVALMKVLHQESEERNRKLTALAEQLGRARIEALTAAQSKSAFLATMSHEIRTPLNGVLGVAQLLIDSGLDPERLKLAETIQSSGEILLRLLNDILDLSKIEAGKMDLELIPFEAGDLAKASSALWTARAYEKGLGFAVRCDCEPKQRLMGDPTRLKQILFNLIGNAIKFTETGHVEVVLEFRPVNPARKVLRAEVRDTGCGVPEAARERLFKSFTQADGATSRRYGGTGLGLTICKSLVKLMGGSIGVRDNDGDGSAFWFEVPLGIAETAVIERKTTAASAAAPVAPIEAPAPGVLETEHEVSLAVAEGPRILLAEDNPINQEVVRGFLKLQGWACDIAANGLEAVEAVQAKPYDVILMDIQMPGMDGLEATRRIRAMNAPLSDTPIIALTANAMRGDEKRCLEAGMDAYVSKPIEKETFFDAIRRAAEHGRGRADEPHGASVA